MKTVIILSDVNNTTIETDWSAGAIAQCFEEDGYCLLTSNDKSEQYMITPQSILFIKTNFHDDNSVSNTNQINVLQAKESMN